MGINILFNQNQKAQVARRHVGLLTIEVIEARGLKKYDVLGKSDPFVELSTIPLAREKTAVKKKTLAPTWNETKHVLVQVRCKCWYLSIACLDAPAHTASWQCRSSATMASTAFPAGQSVIYCSAQEVTPAVAAAVQEPSTQFLRVEMFDHDLFQPKVRRTPYYALYTPCCMHDLLSERQVSLQRGPFNFVCRHSCWTLSRQQPGAQPACSLPCRSRNTRQLTVRSCCSLQELLNLNIIKGATEVVGAQELMGRAMVQINRFSQSPCQEFDDWCTFLKIVFCCACARLLLFSYMISCTSRWSLGDAVVLTLRPSPCRGLRAVGCGRVTWRAITQLLPRGLSEKSATFAAPADSCLIRASQSGRHPV